MPHATERIAQDGDANAVRNALTLWALLGACRLELVFS
jgi:hypothetical protein